MSKNNKNKNLKKYLKIGILSLILLTIIFFSTAYINGKNVTEEGISLQWVSHTEYWKDDHASTIVRLSDYKGNPIEVDECNVTILYPDKSVFVNNQPLSKSEIIGNWYRSDYLGEIPVGTYEQEVFCKKGNKIVTSSQSFHLNPALEQINTLTKKSDNLDLKLSDVNVVVTGKIAETGENITTNITELSTSLNTLLDDINTDLSTQITQGIHVLQTDFSDVNVYVTGVVKTTGQEIQTNLSNVNENLGNILSNVNSSILEQLEVDYNALQANLNDVSLDISATLTQTGETINTNITTSNTSLTNLLTTINQNLLEKLGEDFNQTQTNLSNISFNLSAKLDETQEEIKTEIQASTSSLTNLLNTINTNVLGKMDSKFQEISEQLTDVSLELSGVISETGETITTSISASNISLTNLINSVNVDLTSEITQQFNNTNALIATKFSDSQEFIKTKVEDLNFSLVGKINLTGQEIKTQITSMNDSLVDLINDAIVGDISEQLNDVLSEITSQIIEVKQDTNWLVSNAINQTDMQEIRNKFAVLNNNMNNLENFCSTADTNNSELCKEIYNIKQSINVMNQTQEQKLNEIHTVNINTWNLLSGDIATKIDSLLTDIGIIKAQTTDINSTVHQILDNQESEINIRIIS